MMLLIHGKTQKFNDAGFKRFLRSRYGLSPSLARLAAGKLLEGEPVALGLHDLSNLEALDKLGVSYNFQP